MKKLIFIFFSILLFSACQKKPENLIPRQTYKQVLKELILADLVKEKYPKKDSLDNSIIRSVYKKYNVDSLSLKKTTDYYSNHPGELAKIYAEIHDEFKKKADSLEKLVPKEKPKTDKIKLNKNLLHPKKFIKKKS